MSALRGLNMPFAKAGALAWSKTHLHSNIGQLRRGLRARQQQVDSAVDSAVRRWLTRFDAEMAGCSGIGKPLTAEQWHIRQLEIENRQLKKGQRPAKKRRRPS